MVLLGSFDGEGLDYLLLTLGIERFHFPHIALVRIRVFEAEFFYKCLFDNVYISVFAKHQWNHNPMIGRAYLPVGSMVAHKGLRPPLFYIGGCPVKILSLSGVFSGFVSNV